MTTYRGESRKKKLKAEFLAYSVTYVNLIIWNFGHV